MSTDKLSKANANKLIMDGVYVADYHDFEGYSTWCRNWYFTVHKHSDGKSYSMVDTYYSDRGIRLTDENFDKFKFLFSKSEVIEVDKDNLYRYDEDDIITALMDSGGVHYPKYYVRKGTKPSKNAIRLYYYEKYKSALNEVERYKSILHQIDEDEYYELK